MLWNAQMFFLVEFSINQLIQYSSEGIIPPQMGQMGLERHEGGQIRAEFSLLGELFL